MNVRWEFIICYVEFIPWPKKKNWLDTVIDLCNETILQFKIYDDADPETYSITKLGEVGGVNQMQKGDITGSPGLLWTMQGLVWKDYRPLIRIVTSPSWMRFFYTKVCHSPLSLNVNSHSLLSWRKLCLFGIRRKKWMKYRKCVVTVLQRAVVDRKNIKRRRNVIKFPIWLPPVVQ